MRVGRQGAVDLNCEIAVRSRGLRGILMKDCAALMALGSIAVLLPAVVLAPGQEIRIAAAADLKFAMGELAEEFEKES